MNWAKGRLGEKHSSSTFVLTALKTLGRFNTQNLTKIALVCIFAQGIEASLVKGATKPHTCK
jgi:hypothetical protein